MISNGAPVGVVRLPDREVEVGPEAALLAACYAVAGPLAQGRRVLAVTWDGRVGPALLAQQFAADEVAAVNVSGVPLDGMTQAFSPQNLQWKQAPLEDLPDLFEPETFDVAVAVGVVEHLEEPGRLFAGLREMVHRDGHIVVSSGNDVLERSLAVQPDATEVNRFAENTFRDLAETVLGPCDRWIRGTAVEGFVNLVDRGGPMTDPAIGAGVSLVAGEGTALSEDASYFVGVWGPARSSEGISGALVSSTSSAVQREHAEHDGCQSALQHAQAELGRIFLQLRAAQEENYLIRDSVGLLVAAGMQDLRDAVDAQTTMIDERDAYIKVLEQRVDRLATELQELVDSTDWYRRRPKVRKTVEVVTNYRQRKKQPPADDAQ